MFPSDYGVAELLLPADENSIFLVLEVNNDILYIFICRQLNFVLILLMQDVA